LNNSINKSIAFKQKEINEKEFYNQDIQFKNESSKNSKSDFSNKKSVAPTPPPEILISELSNKLYNNNNLIKIECKEAQAGSSSTNEKEKEKNKINSQITGTNNGINFNIHFANESIKIFQKKYTEFYSQVNSEQKIAFKLQDNISEYIKGFNPKVLLAVDSESNKIIAICCVQYDSLYDNFLRLLIKNFICLQYEKFELFANAFMNFILKNFPCEEIFFDLYYEFKNGNFEVNSYLLNILKKSLGFKWTKLENKIGERYQKMSIKVNQGVNMNLKTYNQNYQPGINSEDLNSNDKLDSKNNLFSLESENLMTVNSNISSAKNANKPAAFNMKKLKSSLEIVSSSVLKFINNNENSSDPANAAEAFQPFDIEKFEENANFFLIMHSLLNINNIEEYKVNGELVNSLDLDKLKVK